jgi:hypothetical protein
MRKSGGVWRAVAESEVAKYFAVLPEVLLGSFSGFIFDSLLACFSGILAVVGFWWH